MPRRFLFSIVAVLALLGLVTDLAHAHSVEVAYSENCGTVTFYVGHYHTPLLGPSGGVILGGTRYNFTGIMTPATFAGVTVDGTTGNISTLTIRQYQTVTITGLLPGSYTVSTTCDTAVECPFGTFPNLVVATSGTIDNCPSDVTLECTSASGASHTLSIDVTDVCGRALTLNFDVDGIQQQSSAIAAGAPGSTTGTVTFPFTYADGAHTVDITLLAGTQILDTCSLTVTVQDTTPPTLSGCPTNTTVECTSPAGATFTYTDPTATDLCDPSPTVTCVPASGSVFGPGPTTVTCTATDANGNSSTCSFVVTVVDTTPPTITCPANITLECSISGGGAVLPVGHVATAVDTCDPAPVITYAPAGPGGTFNMSAPGPTATLVTATATDADGNASSCTFTVTVEDTTRPTISGCPSDITAECTGRRTTVSWVEPTASDICDPNPTLTSNRTPPSRFPLGTRRVRYTATDASGNRRRCRFNVTIVDTTPPTVTCPADQTIECVSPAGAPAIFGGVVTDICDQDPSMTYSHPSGTVFAPGTTTVTMTGTDTSGNSSTCTFDITVQDTTPPLIDVPGVVYLEATSAAGAQLPATTTATVTDNCDASPLVTYSPLSPGDTFPIGTTFVTCRAEDFSGNVRTSIFTVRVRDTTAPAITCPANLTVECTGAAITYTPTATDAVDGSPTITCVPPSGSNLALGTHMVSCTATDTVGNSSTCTFFVTVQDTTGPTITCNAPITVTATGPAGANVTFSLPNGATAVDDCDSSPTIVPTRTSGSFFPIGVSDVEVTATDDAGNQSTCSFTVHVLEAGEEGEPQPQ